MTDRETIDAAAARSAVLASQVAAPGETSLTEVAERVAGAVAEAEDANARDEWRDRFRNLIEKELFLPSVPTLANAGRGGQLAACFALELEDSLESIYGSLHRAARIQQGSGGIGVEFSALRPRHTPVARSGGLSPGPVAFTELFACSAHVMGMAGRRAGAHLAILRDDHPDIVEFARAKRDAPGNFPQLGFAIALSDKLLRAARDDEIWELRYERAVVGHIAARALLHEIAESILDVGDPTLLFVDRIDADNPTPSLGALRATNPCGEQPLLSGESCVLGSIHLPALLSRDGELDEAALARTVQEAVRFLDDAVTVNRWPDAEIAHATLQTRKVGLGIMGIADLLLLRGLPHDSPEAREYVDRILARIAHGANAASLTLGTERGAFPAWERGPRQRNATTRALAPTGTLRLLAGCSPGIEPFLAPCVTLQSDHGELFWSDRWLCKWLETHCSNRDGVLEALAAERPHTELPGLSEANQALLRRAWEISSDDQLAMQATAQRWVDGAVSKTVHLDVNHSPTPATVVRWIQRARQLDCKGVAFYRHDGTSGPVSIDLRASCATCA